jgi:hypothetical protein
MHPVPGGVVAEREQLAQVAGDLRGGLGGTSRRRRPRTPSPQRGRGPAPPRPRSPPGPSSRPGTRSGAAQPARWRFLWKPAATPLASGNTRYTPPSRSTDFKHCSDGARPEPTHGGLGQAAVLVTGSLLGPTGASRVDWVAAGGGPEALGAVVEASAPSELLEPCEQMTVDRPGGCGPQLAVHRAVTGGGLQFCWWR